MYISMDHLSTAIIHRLLLQEQSSTIIIKNSGKCIGTRNKFKLSITKDVKVSGLLSQIM